MLASFVTGYELSVFLHITVVVVGFGATFAEAITFPVAMRLDPRHLPYVHRLQRSINQWLATPAQVLVLATGFYQVADGDWDLGDVWIGTSILIVVVLAGLVHGYFVPSDRRLEAMISGEVEAAGGGEFTPSEEYMRQARTQGIVGTVTGLLLVLAIFLMVTKPGL
ncbi:MAG TPA: DUF2269 family protein [Thermoleophilaceae bacterium]